MTALVLGGAPPALATAPCKVSQTGGTVATVSNSSPTGNCILVQSSATVTGNVINTGTGVLTATGGGAPSTTGITIKNSTVGGSVSNAGTISVNSHGIVIQSNAVVTNGISNSGTITASNDGIVLVNLATFEGGVSNSGTISAGGTGISAGNLTTFGGGIVNSGRITAIDGCGQGIGSVSTFSGGMSNGGTISSGFAGMGANNLSMFSGGIINTGRINMTSCGSAAGIVVRNVPTFSGNISNSGTIVSADFGIRVLANVTFAAGSAIVNSGTIAGGIAAIDVSQATSPVTINQVAGAILGDILLSSNADVLNISGGFIKGNIVGAGSSDTINFDLGAGNTFTYFKNFTGINQVNVNSGTVVLNGADTATLVDVVGGGTLAGTGSLSATTLTIHSGGTFAPGPAAGIGTMSITGGITFNSGSAYAVQITSAGANSLAAVTGSATLGGNGTVVVTPQSGAYNATIYQILTTTTGVNGHFAGVTLAPGHFFTGTITLDYTTNPGSVDLDVTSGAAFVQIPLPAGANQNQAAVLNAINNAINGGFALPPQFQNLTNIPAPALLNALTVLSGENAADANKGATGLMTSFLDLMLDFTLDGRLDGVANQFAPHEPQSFPHDVALAYASVLKAPPPQETFGRWHVWGSVFGGTSRTSGNGLVGSTNVTAGDFGFAAGADYRVDVDTLFGFALAGAGTNWSLAQGLGGGRSDAFQAGVYGRHQWGTAYVSGALAFAEHWFTTDRTALADRLRATFTGQSVGMRLEGGYRYAVPVGHAVIGITPYAALQSQWFHTPTYSETDLTGGGFGLAFASRTANDTRAELGARLDDRTMLGTMPLILRGRLAWAHDWFANPALGAAFQALPGSAFIVNGAAPPHDAALTTASAQFLFAPRWSFTAKFDGEFASGAQTYTGTGTLRYAW